MKSILKNLILAAAAANLCIALFFVFRYDSGELEAAKAMVARECIWQGRSDVAQQMLAQITDVYRRQDVLASLAASYLKSDRKKTEKIAEGIVNPDAKDLYLLYRIILGVDGIHSASAISSRAMRAYAIYCEMLKMPNSISTSNIEEIAELLRNERNFVRRDEFALKMIRAAIANDRFGDVLKFAPMSIFSPERNAILIESFKCSNSKKAGLEFKRNTNTFPIFATYAVADSILAGKGRDAYFQSFNWAMDSFLGRRKNYDSEMTYPIIVNFSNAVKRAQDKAEFLKKSEEAINLPKMWQNLDTYSEIFTVSLCCADEQKSALKIFGLLRNRDIKIKLVRKYAHLLSDRGNNIDELMRIVSDL